jgi:hypothetical protein
MPQDTDGKRDGSRAFDVEYWKAKSRRFTRHCLIQTDSLLGRARLPSPARMRRYQLRRF